MQNREIEDDRAAITIRNSAVFGFRFSPFRFPSLGPTQGSWPVHVSCVETSVVGKAGIPGGWLTAK